MSRLRHFIPAAVLCLLGSWVTWSARAAEPARLALVGGMLLDEYGAHPFITPQSSSKATVWSKGNPLFDIVALSQIDVVVKDGVPTGRGARRRGAVERRTLTCVH